MNFIYTYVPKEDDKKLNSEFYLIDVILLILSVSKIKRFKSEDDRIVFYSTPVFYSYFKDLNIFDEFIEVPNIDDYLKNQSYDLCHKNCLYKIFVAKIQNEPFITLDHDFIIYDKSYFDRIKKTDLVFAFQEFLTEPIYSKTYLPTYDDVVKLIGNDSEILVNVKKDYSINVSISGGNRLDIIKKSYTNICDFYIQNIEKLNTIPLMTMFLEQFLFRTQINNYNVTPYYCWEDLKQGKCHHFTGFRYEDGNRKRIVKELIEENPNAYDYITKEFGFFPSYMIKITDLKG